MEISERLQLKIDNFLVINKLFNLHGGNIYAQLCELAFIEFIILCKTIKRNREFRKAYPGSIGLLEMRINQSEQALGQLEFRVKA